MNSTDYAEIIDDVLDGRDLEISGLGYFDALIPEIVGRLPVSGIQWARIMLPRMALISGVSMSGKMRASRIAPFFSQGYSFMFI